MSDNSASFAKLKSIQQRIGKTLSVPQRIAPSCAERFTARTMGYFASKVDPYGGGWKPLVSAAVVPRRAHKLRWVRFHDRQQQKAEQAKRRTGKAHSSHTAHSILVDSGAMRGSVSFVPVGDRVKFSMGVSYARYHISAGGRRYAPAPGRFPATWRADIDLESGRAFRDVLEGRS